MKKYLHFSRFLVLLVGLLTLSANYAWGAEETLSQTLTYDTWTYSGSTTNKSSYRLFHKDSYIESKEFDLSTLSKVVVYGGTFGGDIYNKLTIGDGTNTWKSVTVSGSSQTGVNTYTDGTTLSGTGKLRITSNSGTASSNGVRISKVEIYTTSSVTYTNYLTECSNEPTLYYDANGGTIDPASTTTSPAILPTPTKAGYNFEGWCENADLSDASPLAAGTDYPFTASKTLYAKWSAKQTTITLDLNGGNTGATTVTATYGEALPSFTLATRDETNTYQYRLAGYYTTKTGGGDIMVIDAEGKLVKSVSGYTDDSGNWIKEDATLTLNARWDNYCKVTWLNNGVEVATTYVKQGTTIGESTDGMQADLASGQACSTTHTTFVGWYTEPSGEESNPANAAPATKVTGSTQVTAKVKYYAVWANGDIRGKEISYTITFGNSANSNTNITTSTQATTIIKESSRTYVQDKPISEATNSYYGDNQTSIRIGKSDASGSLTLKLSDAGKVAAHKIVVNTKLYNSSKSATLSVNNATAQNINANSNDLTFSFDGSSVIDAITLSTSLYAYVYSIKVYSAEPSTATGYISSCCTSQAVAKITPTSSNLELSIEGTASTTVTHSVTGTTSYRLYGPEITPADGGATATLTSANFKTTDGSYTFNATKAGTYTLKHQIYDAAENIKCSKYESIQISVEANPILATSEHTLTVDGVCGQNGTPQTFTVDSRYLTSNPITASVATSTGTGGKFTISTDGTTYSQSVTFDGGTDEKSTQTIYVRYEGITDESGDISGSISITGGGATEQTINLSGTCTCDTYITLTATDDNATHITAPKDQWTQSQTPIKIHGGYLQKNISTGNGVNIKLTSSNPNFKFTTGATSGAATFESGKKTDVSYDQDIYIVYTPTAYNQSEEATITAQVITFGGITVQAQQTITVYGRSLPETFVLAVNTGNDEWVAVPADMIPPYGSGSGCATGVGTHDPYPIKVDDPSDPTKATIVPTRAVYKGAARCTPTTNPWTVRFESQSQTGYYLWGSASVAEGSEAAATGDALTTIANQSYSASERTKWVLETKDNTTYQIHLDASLNTNKLGYNGTAKRIGQYKSTASSYKYDFRILPIEGEPCAYYINPVMTYSAYDATHSTLSIPYDGTTAYEYSTDGKNTWTAVTGTIDCKTLNLEFDNATVEGKELWLRAAGTICNGDATSETATHMLNPTITATTPQTFTGVQNTAFTGSFTINLSDIWTGAGGGVTITSSNSEIAATLSPLSGSTSYTGEATITLSMGAKPADDYHTTLTISSVGAASQTVNVTIHIQSLATLDLYLDYDIDGVVCQDWINAESPIITWDLGHNDADENLLYKDGTKVTATDVISNCVALYDVTTGKTQLSGLTCSISSVPQVYIDVKTSNMQLGHTYRFEFTNNESITNAAGLLYADAAMEFTYIRCDIPTALPACNISSTGFTANWSTEACSNGYDVTVDVYKKDETEIAYNNCLQTSAKDIANSSAWASGDNKKWKAAQNGQYAARDLAGASATDGALLSASNNKSLLYSPTMGADYTDQEIQVTFTIKSNTTKSVSMKVAVYTQTTENVKPFKENTSNQYSYSTDYTKEVSYDGVTAKEKSFSATSTATTYTIYIKGLASNDRIVFFGSEGVAAGPYIKNITISSLSKTSVRTETVSCSQGTLDVSGLSSGTQYYYTVSDGTNTSNEIAAKTRATNEQPTLAFAQGALNLQAESACVTETISLNGENLAVCSLSDLTISISGSDAGKFSYDASQLSLNTQTGALSGDLQVTYCPGSDLGSHTATVTATIGTLSITLPLHGTNCPAGFSMMATAATGITATTATANWSQTTTGYLMLSENAKVNTNLLLNPGFETGNTTGWGNAVAAWQTPTITDDADGRKTGSYGVYIPESTVSSKALQVDSKNYGGAFANQVTLSPGTYTMTVWVRGADDATTTGYLKGSFYLGIYQSGVVARTEVVNSSNNKDWQQISGSFTITQTITAYPFIAHSNSSGNYFLDEATLVCTSGQANENFQEYSISGQTSLALSGLRPSTSYSYYIVNESGCESNIITFNTLESSDPVSVLAEDVSIVGPVGYSTNGTFVITTSNTYANIVLTNSCGSSPIKLQSTSVDAYGGVVQYAFKPTSEHAAARTGTCEIQMMTTGLATPATMTITWTVTSGLDINTPIVEVTDISNSAITIEHNQGTNDNVRIVINREKTEEEIIANVGDELFFSKYYEAYSSKKLWAIYNPTNDTISLQDTYVWRSKSDGSDWNITLGMDLSEMGNIKPGYISPHEELIVYTSDKVGSCEKSKADMSNWVSKSSSDATLSFDGDDALILVRKVAEGNRVPPSESNEKDAEGTPLSLSWRKYKDADENSWWMLDMIGARKNNNKPDLSAANSKWTWTCNEVTESGDEDGWIGIGVYLDETKYQSCGYTLSTNRCLLIRKMSVKSGNNAIATNIGDMYTLNSEWKGAHVPTKGDQDNVSCENFAFVGGYDYDGYYNAWQPEKDIEQKNATKNADGSYTVTGIDVPKYYCKPLRIEIYAKEVINGEEIDNIKTYTEYKVPIVVDKDINTNDENYFTNPSVNNTLTEEICKECDVVIRDEKKLSHVSDGRKEFRDMYIYPGAKFDNSSTQAFTLSNLYVESKNDMVGYAIINNDGSSISISNVAHVKRIDDQYWYLFSLPYDCRVSDIRQLNGKAMGIYGTDWCIKTYDGEARQKAGTSASAGGVSNFYKKLSINDELKAYHGYIIGLYTTEWDGQMKSIYFPPKVANAYTESGNDAKETYISNWKDNLTCEKRHHGWNLIGSPYISLFKPTLTDDGLNYTTETKLIMGQINTSTGVYENTDHVYVSVSDGGSTRTYTQRSAATFALEPFKAYFVQALDPIDDQSHDDLLLTYSKQGRTLSKKQAVVGDNNISDIQIELQVVNANHSLTDNTGVIVGTDYTADYEIPADLTKMYAAADKPQLYTVDAQNEKMAYQALPDALAHAIPLELYAPEAGTYTLSLIRYASRVADAQAVRLLYEGSQVADLLTSDYTIAATGRGIVSGYTIDIQRAPEVSTWVQGSEAGAVVVSAKEETITIQQIPDHAAVQIVDMLGRVLTHQTANTSTMQYTVPAVGVYQVVIRTPQANQVAKVVVK